MMCLKKVTVLVLAIVFSFSCSNDDGKEDGNKSDPLITEKESFPKNVDSLKRLNPLLILPPDSDYSGTYIDKYPNGIKKFVGYFRFGQRHGQWLSFFNSGNLWSEMNYDKGFRHGPNLVYFENGKKRYTGFYKNDYMDSLWTYYDSTENIATQLIYKNNKIVKQIK